MGLPGLEPNPAEIGLGHTENPTSLRMVTLISKISIFATFFTLLFPCKSPSSSCAIFLCMFLHVNGVHHVIMKLFVQHWRQPYHILQPAVDGAGGASTIVLRTVVVSTGLLSISFSVSCFPRLIWRVIHAAFSASDNGMPFNTFPLLFDIHCAMLSRAWSNMHRSQFHLLWGSISTHCCCVLVCSPWLEPQNTVPIWL